jgi:hypothetical protein
MSRVILFEYIAIAILLFVLISQVIVPACRGTKLFPRFRKEAKILDNIVEVKQELREKELTGILNHLRRKKAPKHKAKAKPDHDEHPNN